MMFLIIIIMVGIMLELLAGGGLAYVSHVHIIWKMKVFWVGFSHHVVLMLLVNYRLLIILLLVLFLLSSLFSSSWSLFSRGGESTWFFAYFVTIHCWIDELWTRGSWPLKKLGYQSTSHMLPVNFLLYLGQLYMD